MIMLFTFKKNRISFKNILIPGLIFFITVAFISNINAQNSPILFPNNNTKQVNIDTHLKLTFSSTPKLGKSGKIRVFDMDTDTLVDCIDISIPAGPTQSLRNAKATYTKQAYEYIPGNFTNANTKAGKPSGEAGARSDTFQLTIIGGFTDGFHFYPIIIHENTATIYLHHNLLQYNKSYYVLVDSSVVISSAEEFKGFYSKSDWTFSTKTNEPQLSNKQLVVDSSGKADFNTVQGAMDFIPDFNTDTIIVFIKNGIFEELVYFRNKSNVIIKGEDRNKVIVQYANNEVFNPHPWNIKTNEWPGTFPSRRAAFAIDNCTNIQLLNLTVKTLLKGQAEGLLINGNRIVIKHVNIVGDGDALQTNGSAYFEDVRIDGGGDMILGRGPAFFNNCTFYSPGPFMWIRNTQANHGNVFVNCAFMGTRPNGSELARAPENKGYAYPYSEAVLLNCTLKNIVPQGWGQVGGDKANIHYWEYMSVNIEDTTPVDVSKRTSFSRQLAFETDSMLINQYMNPGFVLNGWNPISKE